MIQFPTANSIQNYLLNLQFFKNPYYEDKGITQTITKLVAERFAEQEFMEQGINLEVATIIFDLQRGTDAVTGKELPKLKSVQEKEWAQISVILQAAMLNINKAKM